MTNQDRDTLNDNKKQIILWGHENLKHIFIRIMRRYAMWTPLPVIPVGGYPKSGTTWASRMIARYLDLPLIMASDLAFGFRYVVHHHWSYNKSIDHSIQVIRDGRDVMVSLYMNLMKCYTGIKTALNGLESTKPGRIFRENVGLYAKRKKQFKQIFGNDFDPWDVRKNLPAFIEHELQKPFLPAVQESWPKYVSRWMQGESTVVVKYEDLLEGGPATLGRILSSYTGDFAQGNDVRAAFAQYEFKKMAGRLQGDEDPMSFFRKGISGDWKKLFSRSLCRFPALCWRFAHRIGV